MTYVSERVLGRGSLSRSSVPGLGPIWASGGLPDDLSTLAREVEEYFDLGLRVSAGDSIVDVGANVGVFAISAAARAQGPLHFAAIEPIPDLHEALARNFRESPLLAGCDARLFRAGITNEPDELDAEFTYFTRLPRDSTRYAEGKQAEFERAFATWGADGNRWITRHLRSAALGEAVGAFVGGIPREGWTRWLFERAIGKRSVRCAMMTLAQVLDGAEGDVHVLKVDVEGAELDVLTSARRDQWSRVHQVVVETNDLDQRLQELCTLLREVGLSEQTLAQPDCSLSQHLESALVLARRPER